MNNRIGLEALRVLDAIESVGSFHGAAEMLHKVPSAISHAVRKLEDDLGVSLYDRSRRRAELTVAGREVLSEGRRILRAVSELEARARYAAGGWEPEFSIAMDHQLPLNLLLPALKEFQHEAPEVTVNITRETLDGTWDALIWRRADLAIGAGGMGAPSGECRSHVLGDLSMVYVAAPEHPLAQRDDALVAEEMFNHRFIDSADTARVSHYRLQGVAESNGDLSLVDLRDKLEALRIGMGFGMLPTRMAAIEVRAKRLVELKITDPPSPLPVQFAVRRQATGKALNWFAEALEKMGSTWLEQAYD